MSLAERDSYCLNTNDIAPAFCQLPFISTYPGSRLHSRRLLRITCSSSHQTPAFSPNDKMSLPVRCVPILSSVCTVLLLHDLSAKRVTTIVQMLNTTSTFTSRTNIFLFTRDCRLVQYLGSLLFACIHCPTIESSTRIGNPYVVSLSFD